MAKRKQTASPTSKPKVKKHKKEDVVIAPIVSSDEPVERQKKMDKQAKDINFLIKRHIIPGSSSHEGFEDFAASF